MSEISILAFDLANGSFLVCGVTAVGAVVFNGSVTRPPLYQLLAESERCVVAMEAYAMSHRWGRVVESHCHEVRLIPTAYVKPFVKHQEKDQADSEAIAEAACRPSMRLVAVKSADKRGRAVAF